MNNEKCEMQEKCACGCEAESSAKSERVENRKIYRPAVDILDGEGETLLYADMPGVDEANVDITLEKSVLTIKGKVDRPDHSGRQLIYSEYGVGDFERSFTLSENVDRERISASIKDGVLVVKLPKAVPSVKKIEVSSVN